MSRAEEATEVTLKTEVEAGVSGYSVTGGGDQGIFVKQVLQGSSAARLFSLREGDQLLSATVFFDNISYEDALKILQYSEPYKVQLEIKRQLPAGGDGEQARGAAQHAPKRTEKQDAGVACGSTDTPVKTLEAEGDQERLISKPREGRGRRPRGERLSWPKFQAIQTKRGPRRSRSSSEAYERGKAPDVSPTSSDAEAPFLTEEQERRAGPGSQRRRRLLNLQFKKDLERSDAEDSGACTPGRKKTTGKQQERARQGDQGRRDKQWAARDSRFKMPKFKMPSFGVSASGKPIDASVDVSLPSMQAEVKTSDISVELPSADVDVKTGELGVRLPEGHLPKVQMPSIKMPKVDFKGPQVDIKGPQVDIKGPQVDLKGPQVDIKGPKLDLKGAKGQVSGPDMDVSLPSVEVDVQALDAKLEGDLGLGDKEGASKFKMPKFKMPSFGVSVPGKDLGTSVDVTVPKATGEVILPSVEVEIQAPEGGIQLPSAEMELPGAELEVSLPQGEVTLGDLKGKAEGARFKGHLPKVHMPSIKMPKMDIKGPQMDLKGPQLDIKGPKLDLKGVKGQVTSPDMDVSLPSVEVDVRAPSAKLEGDLGLDDKEGTSKFKMPKFKMPSFGVSVPGKDLGTSVDVTVPKATGEVSLSSVGVEIQAPEGGIQLPSAEMELPGAELEISLPQGEVTLDDLKGKAEGARFKGHLPKVHMPSIKMPKMDIKGPQVDLKGPQVDIKGPKLDLKGAKGQVTGPDMDVSLPSVEVDVRAPSAKLEGDLGLDDKEGTSKFKMPKFKMPSFGVSSSGKPIDASVDVSLPSMQAEVKTSDISVELPSADVDVKTGELGVRLPEGHLPKVQMPSIKMPKVDFKGPQVDIKGTQMEIKGPQVDLKGPQVDIKGPKLDLKGAKGQVTGPDMDVSLPSVEVDMQAPGATLEGDLGLGDKEGASKFKMPKFKMPSFGLSVPGKDLGTSVDVTVPKATGEVSLSSVGVEIQAPEGGIQLPSAEMELPGAELEISLPQGEVTLDDLKGKAEGARFKGHLPKVHMPSIKMPKMDIKGPQVDLKGPQVDIKGPKLDLKGAKGQVTGPDMDVSLPSVEVDVRAPSAKLEGDLGLDDKEGTSKFKMPKFKMPSFGVSVPGKDLGTSVDVTVPKATGEVSLSSVGVEIQAPEGGIQLPSAEMELPGAELEISLPQGEVTLDDLKGKAEGARFKGHLPKVHMPSIKMPKMDIKGPQVDLKGPQVDIKGPKLDLKGAKGQVTGPDMDVSLPSVEVDVRAPSAKLEGDLGLDDKEGTSKFKMPKFKMPSFGVSSSGKPIDASVDVSLPSMQAEVKTSDISVELPSADVDVKTGELGVRLPEGHLPKVQMPSIKMPKVDFKGPQVDIKGTQMEIKGPQVDLKGPQVDIKGPKLDLKGAKGQVTGPDMDVSLPSVEVDMQAPGATLEGDLGLGDKEGASKFKMPKFKMPSFGLSVPGKDLGTSVDVTVPKATGEVSLSSVGVEIQAPEGGIQLPSAEMELPGAELEISLPQGEVTLDDLKGKAEGARFKGHLPKVHMPSIKMPKMDIKGPQVDLKGPQVDIKGPKLDLKGAKGQVTGPDMDVSLPSVEVDVRAPSAKLEGDLGLDDKEGTSKFKMPKFKMPSFGVSSSGKPIDASVDVSLPSMQAEVKTSDISVELPSADVDVKTGELGVRLPEGHLPKVQMPSIKMPKVDFKGPQVDIKGTQMEIKGPQVDLKGPQVDIKGPKLDLKGVKGQVTSPDMDVSLPSVEVDVRAPSAKLEGDLGLDDKEGTSKFKMPKFKMPSFGVSVPGKDLGTSVDVTVPKATGEVSLSSVGVEIQAPEGGIQLPSAEMELPGAELEISLPQGEVTLDDLKGKAEGARFKGHLPKVHMPSIKMPKVDFKGPHVDIKGPQMDLKEQKLDVKGTKGQMTGPDMDVSLPSVEVDVQASDAKLKGDLGLGDKEGASKFKMPKFKMPSFGVSVPRKDLGTSVDVTVPKATGEVSLSSMGVEIQAPEGGIQLPSAEMELPGAELEVSLPQGEITLDDLKGKAEGAGFKGHLPKVHMPSIKMPKMDIKGPQMDIKGPQVDIKGPQVDLKGPKLDLKGAKGQVTGPDMDVSLPSVEVDVQAPGATLQGDLGLGDKEGTSKFKMPKFKMPSFGVSVPGKDLGTSVDVTVPKATGEVSLPSVGVEIQAPEGGIQLPSAEMELPGAELEVSLPQGEVTLSDLKGKAEGARFKGHLPKVHMPSIKMPKMDIKGPQMDIKGPQVDLKGPKLDVKGTKGEVTGPDMDVSLPSVEVDVQALDAKLETDLGLGDKEGAGKFKMPKVKMPSFGMSVPGKDLGTSVEVTVPKATGEVSLPSVGVEIQAPEGGIQLPSAEMELPGAELEVSLPQGEVTLGDLKGKAEGARFKGHLPKVHMPSIKMPKMDIKGPQMDIKGPQVDLKGPLVDIKGPKLDLKAAKGQVTVPDMDVSLPSVEVEVQVPGAKLETDLGLGDKEGAGKFKMPKFKMPSFGVSVPGKDLGTSVEVTVPKATGEVSLPSVGVEIQAPEGGIQPPSAEMELPGAELEVSLPQGEVTLGDLKGKAEGARFKGHLPKVHMPSIKMPKMDIKGPQMDLKGPQLDIKGPKLDLKGAKGQVTGPDMDVSLPSVEVDVQVPGAKLEGDLGLCDKEGASKFNMPKFKMPSFGVSSSGKPIDASVDVSLPSMQAEVKTSDISVELPSADVDVKTGELGVRLPEGHLPKVQMPSIKMPKVDFKGPQVDIKGPQVDIKGPQVDLKGPQVDIKGPKLDLKGAKGQVTVPDMDVSLPSVEVDVQAPGAKLEGDLGLGDKEGTSKFKMHKFKMPSFGVSVPRKDLGTSVDVTVPKATGVVSLPSVGVEIQAPEGGIQLPSSEMELPGAELEVSLPQGEVTLSDLKGKAEGARFKGHLPKVHMPSFKMPKLDFKGPEIDLKGPKVDMKGPKGKVTGPQLGYSVPSEKVDIHSAAAQLESDSILGDQDVPSKFKLPEVRMPCFRPSSSKSLVSSDSPSGPSPSGAGTAFDGSDAEESPGPCVSSTDLHGLSSGPKSGEKSKIKKPHFKIPKAFSPPGKAPPFLVTLEGGPGAPLAGHAGAAPEAEGLSVRVSGEPPVSGRHLGRPGVSSASHGVGSPVADSSVVTSSEPGTLTKHQATAPRGSVSGELPAETSARPQGEASRLSAAPPADPPSWERVSLSPAGSPAGPVDALTLTSDGRVTFPKFHGPKFGFTVSAAAAAHKELQPGGCALSFSRPVSGADAEEALVGPWPATQPLCAGVSMSQGMQGSAGTSAMASGAGPAEDTDHEGKSSPLKMPRLRLPSFRRSPKKEVAPKGAPGQSLAVEAGVPGAPGDGTPGNEGEKGKVKAPGFAVPKLALSKMKSSKGGDPEPALAGSASPAAAGVAPHAAPGASSEGPPESVGMEVPLPQVLLPGAGFAGPDLRPSSAAGGLPPPAQDLSPQEGSGGHGLGADPASLPVGGVAAPAAGSQEGDSAAGAASAGSQDSWFRMPSLRLPSFWRSSKERDAAGGPGAQQEGEAPATVARPGLRAPASGVAAPVSPPPSEAEGEALGRSLESRDSQAHSSLPTTESSPLGPSAGSRPLQAPGGRPSETQAAPGEPGETPAAGAGGTEPWPSPPEGPLTLKASRTGTPAQVSVVETRQLWADSVLTVRFPALKVPRFTFQAPGSEVDVFVPPLSEVWHGDSSRARAQREDSSGACGASFLKAGAGVPGQQPVALGLPSDASPISKVRVRIQGARVESHEVTMHGRGAAESAQLLGPEAFCTQIVREAEVPASQVQTPSYGFSLLTGKVLEAPLRAQVQLVSPDPPPADEGFPAAAQPAAPGAGPVPGAPQPDPGEPFEVISSSAVLLPGQSASAWEARPGPQRADSCSDEEPAEILEFAPDLGQEEDGAAAEKPGSQQPSGRFRFWLPSIGFSSSAGDAGAAPTEAPGPAPPAPVRTQPEARPGAELPKKPEKAGWFRFPKLGFSSSSPSRKRESSGEGEAGLAGPQLQEEAVTFFDARESFSAEEPECLEPAEAAGPGSAAK
ncbi:protein AHNAK2 isoform 2-T2 [Glossophaga mutica]